MNDFLTNSIFFGVVLSLVTYQVGVVLKNKFKWALCNPLLISSALIIIFLLVFDIEYETFEYGANYITYFLTPATVSLGVVLYKQLNVLKKYPVAILSAIVSGVMTAMITIFALSYAFGLNHQQYISLLPKSITTAIGIGISEKMDGIVGVTIIAICITGLFGNIMAESFCKWFGIKEPIAKGLAIGSCSHAIGTAKAIEMGEVEGAMSSLSLVISGIITVITISIFANFI